jgi:glutaredoxin
MKTYVVLYSRPGCHLCHEAEAAIRRSSCFKEIVLDVVDIDTAAELRDRFGDEIPVVFIGGVKVFKYHVAPREFCEKLKKLTRNKSE